MRFLVALFGVFILSTAISFSAYSQNTGNDNRKVFNSRSAQGGAPPIYNTSGSQYSTGGPLSLNQIVQGKDQAATGSPYASYDSGQNFRPYGLSNNNYALNISDQQIAAYRAERNARAQQREQESLQQLANFSTGSDLQYPDYNQYIQQQEKPKSVKRGNVYIKRENDFDMPKRIFRSIR